MTSDLQFSLVLHLCFKSVCNKEYMGVMISSSNSSQSTRPSGRVLWVESPSFLDFTHNNKRTDEWNFVPCHLSQMDLLTLISRMSPLRTVGQNWVLCV